MQAVLRLPPYIAVLAAASLLPVALAGAEEDGATALLFAGTSCPQPGLEREVSSGLAQLRTPRLAPEVVSRAVARVRARSALEKSRRLFTRADFAGCIAMLSITEQELGRNLADDHPEHLQQAHRLLARVNLWLGTCQWAVGDTQRAASSFVRSSRLPGSPAPDPRLLPPALVQAYSRAVSEPLQEVSCQVEAPLLPSHLLVDGRGPTVLEGSLRLPAGSHYLVMRVDCSPRDAACQDLSLQPGGKVRRSMRMDAMPPSCRILLPSPPPDPGASCVSLAEGEDPRFAAGLARQAGAGTTLVVAREPGKWALRLHRRGKPGFSRQVVSSLEEQEPRGQSLRRSLEILLAQPAAPAPEPPRSPEHRPWYKEWWVWAIAAGVVVAATATTAAVLSQDDRLTVVFGP